MGTVPGPTPLPTLEVRCAVTVWASRWRSSSRACMQLSRGRGSTPSSPVAPSDHASPLSACPEALRTNSTLLSTTQSWKGVTRGSWDQGQLGSCHGRGLRGGAPSHPLASHLLAHCFTGSPWLGVHLLPQQFRVEEGGLTHVLGQEMSWELETLSLPHFLLYSSITPAHVPG